MNARRSKYNNIKTIYNGEVYHSKKEAKYASVIDLCRKAALPVHRVVNVDRQVRYELSPTCNYIADFVVTFADGHVEIIDVKGYRTATYKVKKKWFEQVHAPLKIKEV